MDSWLLRGARVARGPRTAERVDVEIQAGSIVAFQPSGGSPSHAAFLDLRSCLILPGLINAHDHLEFNLFPRQGCGPYPNAGTWARDIYHPHQSPIREHLRIPIEARLRWGAIKNLLSGVTTVSHHNPYDARVFERNFPVRVQKRFGWAHSLEFSPDIASRFRATPSEWPFILHLGEARDGEGGLEIFQLEAKGALDHRTVLVHGVALGREGLRLAKKRGASLVWCPSSNLFLLGRTLNRAVRESGIPMALGTDSALSGKGDLLKELRIARRIGPASMAQIYHMVTDDAARVLRLESGEGRLSAGGIADLVVVRDQGQTPAATLFGLRTGGLELVLVGGKVKLVSPRLAIHLPNAVRSQLRPLVIQDVKETRTVLLNADLPALFRQATRFLGAEIHLAGTKVRMPAP